MASESPTIRISIYDGDNLVREEVFTRKDVRIGKGGQAHLRLESDAVSKSHAIIEVLDSNQVRITDLESTNGTKVNGEKVSQSMLRPGDEIMVGDTKLVVDFERAVVGKSANDSFYAPPAINDVATNKLGLDLNLLWDQKVLGTGFFANNETVLVGVGKGAHFYLPDEVIGSETIELAKPDGNDYLLFVGVPNADGDFLVEGKIIRLAEMKRRGMLVDDAWVRITKTTRARVKFGAFTILVGMSYEPPRPRSSSWKRFNMREHLFLVLSLILHLAFLLMVYLVPEEQLRAAVDPYDRETKAIKKIQVAMLEKKVEEEKAREEEDARKKLAEAAKEAEVSKLSIQPDEKPTSKIVTEQNIERDREVADTALTRVMGDQTELLNRVLDAAGPGLGGATMGIRVIGSGGLDAELAMGLDAFGGTAGSGGGGFQGTGAWGGGSEFGPADLKGISGLGKEDASGSSGRVKFSKGANPVVYTGTYSVSGELDKETVRRYISTKMNQIRWCYQQEVQKNPDLAGQVKISWVILPTGNVTAVKVAETSLNSAPVEQCIAGRIKTWQFPSPKGGGTVRVIYPFIFRVTK